MLRMRCGGALVPLVTLCLALGATSLPIGEDGPHLNHGWGNPDRLRHLFSRGRLYLSIDSDGTVAGTATQDVNCLLQISSVSVGTVAIKGVHSSRYLCMEEEGRLQGRTNDPKRFRGHCFPKLLRCPKELTLHLSPNLFLGKDCQQVNYGCNSNHTFVGLSYSTEDCSFEEEMIGGYNSYKSKKYGILVSLSSARQRQAKGTDFHPLSHFLPITISTLPVESMDFGEYGDSRPSFESHIFNSRLDNDSPDPFGITSDIAVQSPSFGK